MDNTLNVLRALSTKSGMVSGEEIGRQLNITRMAVGKHVKKLRNMGFDIQSCTHSGYTLRIPAELYNGYTVALQLGEIPVAFFDSLFSSNLEAKLAKYTGEGVVVARTQTNGRGRKDRNFVSLEGGVYVSYYCSPPNLTPLDGVKTVLMAGVALVRVLRSYGIEAGLKWPNDVFVEGRKISGTLCEMIASNDRVDKLIVGTGINVGNEIPNVVRAVSLRNLGRDVDRSELVGKYVTELRLLIHKWQAQGFGEILTEYKASSMVLGKSVRVIENEVAYEATALDLDEDGFLIIRTDSQDKRVVTGDVSLGWNECSSHS